MDKIGAYEAKTRLPALLDRVEKGERITITRHGRSVAVLSPVEVGKMPVGEAIKGIFELRKGMRLDGLDIRKLIREGRR